LKRDTTDDTDAERARNVTFTSILPSMARLAPVLAIATGCSMTLHAQVISGRDNVIGIRFTHRFSMEG